MEKEPRGYDDASASAAAAAAAASSSFKRMSKEQYIETW